MMDNTSLSKIQQESYDQNIFFQKKEVGTTNNMTTFIIDQQEDQQFEERPLQTPNQGQEQSMLSITEQEEEEQKLYPYYLGQNHFWVYKVFFIHITSYCLFLKRNVLDKNEKICDIDTQKYSNHKYLPKLSSSENIKQTIEISQQKLDGIHQLHFYDLVKIVFFGELKYLTFISCLSYCFETIAKNGISVIMSLLITSVSQKDMDSAYKYTIGYILLSLIGVFFRHHGSNFSMIFSSQARMLLVNLVFNKLTELSSFSIKEAEILISLNQFFIYLNNIYYLYDILKQCDFSFCRNRLNACISYSLSNIPHLNFFVIIQFRNFEIIKIILRQTFEINK